MKQITPVVIVLISLFSYAGDDDGYSSSSRINNNANDEITQLLLSSRTDQEHVKQQQAYITSIKSITSSNLDNKNITDDTLHKLLKDAYELETLSAQHNNLRQPQPAAKQNYLLTTLDFCNGGIEIFRIGEWIDTYPNLTVIKLAHNKINCIASHDVTERISCITCGPESCGPEYRKAWHSDTLQELDLSHNKLTVFDLNILNNAPNLTKADFSHNEIRDVVVPKGIYHRQVCSVLLHHNQLGDTQKQLLQQENSLYTKDYNKKVGDPTYYSSIAGGFIGFLGILPIGIVGKLGLATVGLVFGTAAGGILLFGASAYTIAHYCYPKNKRTYQPFALEFDATEQDQKDEVVELESQSHQ